MAARVIQLSAAPPTREAMASRWLKTEYAGHGRGIPTAVSPRQRARGAAQLTCRQPRVTRGKRVGVENSVPREAGWRLRARTVASAATP
eukprot:1941866-Prymnesium_polylepis.2